jgi:hypothetical protein
MFLQKYLIIAFREGQFETYKTIAGLVGQSPDVACTRRFCFTSKNLSAEIVEYLIKIDISSVKRSTIRLTVPPLSQDQDTALNWLLALDIYIEPATVDMLITNSYNGSSLLWSSKSVTVYLYGLIKIGYQLYIFDHDKEKARELRTFVSIAMEKSDKNSREMLANRIKETYYSIIQQFQFLHLESPNSKTNLQLLATILDIVTDMSKITILHEQIACSPKLPIQIHNSLLELGLLKVC